MKTYLKTWLKTMPIPKYKMDGLGCREEGELGLDEYRSITG